MALLMHLLRANGAYSMLRVTTEKKRGKTALAVEGRLAGPWVRALEQCWRELHAASPTEKFHIDLCGVSFIDAAGKFLLKEIHRQGGQLIAEGCLNQAIVREIVSDAGEQQSEKTKGSRKGSHIIFYVAFFSLILSPGVARAERANQQKRLAVELPTQVLRLTLDQAVGLALKQN